MTKLFKAAIMGFILLGYSATYTNAANDPTFGIWLDANMRG